MAESRLNPPANPEQQRDGSERTTEQLPDVSKLPEAAQSVGQNLLHSLLDNIDEGISLVDRDYRVVMTNAAMGRLFRKPVCDFVRQQCFAEFQKCDAICPHCPGQQAMETGLPAEATAEGVRDDGSTFPMRIRAWPLTNPDGSLFGFMEMVQELTPPMRAHQTLREINTRLEQTSNFLNALLSALPIPVFYKDAGGRYLGCNAAFTQFTGKSAADLRGKSAADLWTKENAETYLSWDRALIDSHGPQSFEGKVQYADGTDRDVIFSKAVFRGAGNEVGGIVGSFVDITERKRAEKEMRRLAIAVRQAAECIVITDPAGNIEYVNPAFEKTTGYHSEEVLGKNPRVLKSHRQSQEFYRNLWKTITSGRVWSGRFINRKKDGTLYHEDATISPVRDDRGRIVQYVAVKRNVTREVDLEAQFQQAQKMEAIGRLAGGVAHDFNNLLTAIKGNLALAQMDLPANHAIQEFLEEVDKAADRAAGLTRQLLAFSRKQVIEPKTLDLNELILGFRKMLGRLIGEHIDLTTRLQEGAWQIEADPGQIEQLILNLAVNARDAMPDGGHLRISTVTQTLDEFFCEMHPGTEPGDFVVLTVADSGCGMSEEVKLHLFEPFFTTKERGKGTGLGLATVYAVVMQNHGAITVESEPEHGTTFTVYFPRARNGELAAAAAAGSNTALRGTENILFVEDEESLRLLVTRMLARAGYRVQACANGTEALAASERMSDPVDLLVTDVIMPGMNGRELADRLTLRHPTMKTLFTSGYTADVLGKHGVLDEGIEFIAKPYGSEVILKKIRELFDGATEGKV